MWNSKPPKNTILIDLKINKKLFLRKKWCFVSGKVFKVWERPGFWYLVHEKSWGWEGYVLRRRDLLSCQSLGSEKGPINWSCLHMYQLLQSMRFEMYLLVILHF